MATVQQLLACRLYLRRHSYMPLVRRRHHHEDSMELACACQAGHLRLLDEILNVALTYMCTQATAESARLATATFTALPLPA